MIGPKWPICLQPVVYRVPGKCHSRKGPRPGIPTGLKGSGLKEKGSRNPDLSNRGRGDPLDGRRQTTTTTTRKTIVLYEPLWSTTTIPAAAAAAMATATTTTTEACEDAILSYLSAAADEAPIADSFAWAHERTLDPQMVIGAANSLLTENYVATTLVSTSFYTLSDEARTILDQGSQEIRVYQAIVNHNTNNKNTNRMSMADLPAAVGGEDSVAKIGMANCLKNKWIAKDGADLVVLTDSNSVTDTTQQSLRTLADNNYAVDAIDEKVGTNDTMYELGGVIGYLFW